MMKSIDKVNVDVKTKNVGFKKETANLDIVEFYDGDEIKKYAHSLTSIKLPSDDPMIVRWLGDSLVCCSYNGDTYVKNSDNFTFMKRINVVKRPLFSSIVIEGIYYPLLIDGAKKAYRFENNSLIEIGTIDADVICNNGEMLFIAKDRTITFSAPNNMLDFTFAIDRAGQITIEDGYGRIVAMATENRKLIIFTEHAIFEFNPIGSRIDYTLKKIECDNLNVQADSIKDMGDKIVFISDAKIYYYKNGKVYLEQAFLYDNNCLVVNAPATDDKIYYIPIRMSNNKYYLFRYDFESKKYYLISWVSNNLLDGKYPVYKNSNLYQINMVSVSKNSVYTTGKVEIDMKKKILVKVIAYVLGSATLTLSGENGSCQIQLKNGLNEKRIYFPSVKFSMEITNPSTDFEIYEMQVKYKIKGE